LSKKIILPNHKYLKIRRTCGTETSKKGTSRNLWRQTPEYANYVSEFSELPIDLKDLKDFLL
jgi:muconolactone delta-isomerase